MKSVIKAWALLGLILFLAYLCGCGPKHYAAHPVKPPQVCSHGAWSQTEHCRERDMNEVPKPKFVEGWGWKCPNGWYLYLPKGKKDDVIKNWACTKTPSDPTAVIIGEHAGRPKVPEGGQ